MTETVGFAKKKLKSGITTGACAAAAAKGAILAALEGSVSQVEIRNLEGKALPVKIDRVEKLGEKVICWVIKDGGDDPDITHGLEIGVVAELFDLNFSSEKVILLGGTGVGVVTKPGLQISVGQPAINPVPRAMINKAVFEVLPEDKGARLTVIVPKGEEAAKRTLNPKLGIVGGISILGTTGIVRPMSEDAYRVSLVPQISVAKAHGYDTVVLTPGGIGEKQAVERYGFPDVAVVQMSNFVGYMLKACLEEGVKKVILFGHHSKLLKVAGGSFNTHNKVSDGRLETLACFAGLLGASQEVMLKVLASNTAEEALEVIKENRLIQVFNALAKRASNKAEEYIFNQLEVGTILLDLKGNLLGIDEKAEELGGQLGWIRPSR